MTASPSVFLPSCLSGCVPGGLQACRGTLERSVSERREPRNHVDEGRGSDDEIPAAVLVPAAVPVAVVFPRPIHLGPGAIRPRVIIIHLRSVSQPARLGWQVDSSVWTWSTERGSPASCSAIQQHESNRERTHATGIEKKEKRKNKNEKRGRHDAAQKPYGRRGVKAKSRSDHAEISRTPKGY